MTYNSDPSGIRLDIDGRVERLTLYRPEQHNAMETTNLALFGTYLTCPN